MPTRQGVPTRSWTSACRPRAAGRPRPAALPLSPGRPLWRHCRLHAARLRPARPAATPVCRTRRRARGWVFLALASRACIGGVAGGADATGTVPSPPFASRSRAARAATPDRPSPWPPAPCGQPQAGRPPAATSGAAVTAPPSRCADGGADNAGLGSESAAILESDTDAGDEGASCDAFSSGRRTHTATTRTAVATGTSQPQCASHDRGGAGASRSRLTTPSSARCSRQVAQSAACVSMTATLVDG